MRKNSSWLERFKVQTIDVTLEHKHLFLKIPNNWTLNEDNSIENVISAFLLAVLPTTEGVPSSNNTSTTPQVKVGSFSERNSTAKLLYFRYVAFKPSSLTPTALLVNYLLVFFVTIAAKLKSSTQGVLSDATKSFSPSSTLLKSTPSSE